MSTCQYKNTKEYFTCEFAVHDGAKYCLFHDKDYLKGDNYEKNKKKVAQGFDKLYSNHPKGMPFRFIGFCLPQLSFEEKPFCESMYFDDTIFYGPINFNHATFYGLVSFGGVTFSGKAHFFGQQALRLAPPHQLRD